MILFTKKEKAMFWFSSIVLIIIFVEIKFDTYRNEENEFQDTLTSKRIRGLEKLHVDMADWFVKLYGVGIIRFCMVV